MLKFIIEKPSHGYELWQKFKTLTGDMWIPSFSMIYPILRELVEFGLITKKQEMKGRKTMYVYYPTNLGYKAYEEKKKNLAKKIHKMINNIEEKPHLIIPLLFFTTDLGLIILNDLFGKNKKDILIKLKEIIDKISARIKKILEEEQ